MYSVYTGYTGTSCTIKRHIWHFDGSTTSADRRPQPWQRCECGRYTWEEFDRLAYQAEWGHERPVASTIGGQNVAHR